MAIGIPNPSQNQNPPQQNYNNNNNNKPRWSDEDDGDINLDLLLLPPPLVIGPDKNGIKKVIEFNFNEDGNRIKKTSSIRVCKLANTRLSKHALERRSWPKFEDPELGNKGNPTVISTEEVFIRKSRAHVEESNAVGDPSAQVGKGGGVLMLCRTCGKKGDHWTARCPYKDLAPQSEGFTTRPASSDGTKSSSDIKDLTYVPPSMKGVAEKGNGAYIPPSIRKGAERGSGSDMKHRNDENKIHVSNLSEDTREDDLHDLFSSFGPLSHVWVAIDRNTGTAKGYGNVNFVNKVDAERAILKLNGYGYGNLILKVEWSTPKVNKM